MLDQWPEFSFFIETFHYSNAVLFVAKIFVQIINYKYPTGENSI